MSKMIAIFICISGLLLALGFNVADLISQVIVLLVIGGVFKYIFVGRLPDRFWAMLLGVFAGPSILSVLLQILFSKIRNLLWSIFGDNTIPALFLGLLVASYLAYLYARPKVSQLLHIDEREPLTNERQPIIPTLHEREALKCEESESLNSYSEEE